MHRKRFSAFLILASVLLPHSVYPDDIVIGAWNIEWLGKPASRSGIAKNRQQKAEDIAEYIQTGEVDILAVEEVCDDNPNGKLDNSTLGETVTILNGRPNNDWRYHLFPKKNPENETQCVGLMWNQKKVKPEGAFKSSTIPDSVDGVNVWDRGVHAAKFRLAQGKTDIVVIPVHMKSNVGGVYKTREQRAREAEFLIAEITKLRTVYSDEDFVILGDTNVKRRMSRQSPRSQQQVLLT